MDYEHLAVLVDIGGIISLTVFGLVVLMIGAKRRRDYKENYTRRTKRDVDAVGAEYPFPLLNREHFHFLRRGKLEITFGLRWSGVFGGHVHLEVARVAQVLQQ